MRTLREDGKEDPKESNSMTELKKCCLSKRQLSSKHDLYHDRIGEYFLKKRFSDHSDVFFE
jgi:hypothetical protein